MPTRYHIPGLILTDHKFSLPLDYADPEGLQLNVYAREVTTPSQVDEDLPMLVFFQGGPGFTPQRPLGNEGWLKRALTDFRVLLLDQRGTGRSTPVTHQTLAKLETPQAQADYLKYFRADNIVRDAEAIRKKLLGADKRWTILGQSFGGFCVTHYLSAAPEGVEMALITAGLPPLEGDADQVYRATYKRLLEKNRQFYERYPEDEARIWDIVKLLQRDPVPLPGGGVLTPRRFQQLGFGFGTTTGYEELHYMLESAFVDGSGNSELSYAFLREVENTQPFETNPIFAILHEAIYCQNNASNWSAHRIRDEYPEFEIEEGRPVYLTGEMIYPWMFEDYEHLKPLREAAEILASWDDWPRLYDVEKLSRNEVPCAAAIYTHDMYVERAFSEAAAKTIKGMRAWMTSEYEHNGLRADGEVILDRLLAIARGERYSQF